MPDPHSAPVPRLPIGKLSKVVTRLPKRTFDSARRRLSRLRESLRKRSVRWERSLRRLPWKLLVKHYWMRLGDLSQYPPREMALEDFPLPELPDCELPAIGIVTPSYNQAAFITATMASVWDQPYPRQQLAYIVQDGGSTDGTPAILSAHADRLTSWVSAKDRGQADAVAQALARVPGDILAWLNSDDLLMPGALRYVGEYFSRHPEVDVIYGHRVLIDETGMEIGRWVLPPHEIEPLRYADYVPQETLFWRRRVYECVGGVNPDFHFALDWDLLLRFQQAGARIVRLPYFLGCFRVHAAQKTSAQIGSRGLREMEQLRRREHGRDLSREEIDKVAHRLQMKGAATARLLAIGIRV
jgi:hypothetical protein